MAMNFPAATRLRVFWTPKRRVADDYYYTDHTPGSTFGWPLWPVYGYESKSRPGEFLYLIVAIAIAG